MMSLLVNTIVSLAPVFIFLIVLISLDSYKLVRLTAILRTLFVGGMVAVIAYFLNKWLAPSFVQTLTLYTRYVSPIIEETLKAIFILYLMQKNKLGFLVDSAIYGFAVGAGFAVIENFYYLQSLHHASIMVWLIRGFGTAVMHGGTTAIMAILSKSMFDRFGKKYLGMLPGLAAAIFIHSLFNHFFLPPILTTIAQLITLPLILVIVFTYSEQVVRTWLEMGMDSDVQLLDYILTGNISETKIGQYLISLKSKFPGQVVADMLCFLRIHLELAIRAKGLLLLRNAGFKPAIDPEIKDRFNELKYLEKSIGTTGKLALSPILHTSPRDLWQLYHVQDLTMRKKTTRTA
ncbi:PrsW family intramembrane metalloprotease [candidate division KSB1 bacterium]|nr:PrsW family intramembrane metalloprotease [candidate division KSB1 bacterium]